MGTSAPVAREFAEIPPEPARVAVDEGEYDTDLVAGHRCRIEWDGDVRVVYHPSGQLWKREHYRDGRLHGRQTVWNVGGHVVGEFELRDGVRHGPAKIFHEEGQLAAEGSYAYGYRTGRWSEYHPSGSLISRGEWLVVTRNGNPVGQARVGEWSSWNTEGELIERLSGRYVDGELVEDDTDSSSSSPPSRSNAIDRSVFDSWSHR